MQTVLEAFRLDGVPVACEAYGSGHINQTFQVTTDAPHRYILQRINQKVFHNVLELMENVYAVTTFLARQDPDPRHVLTLVPTVTGQPYHRDAQGEYWRVYEFIAGGVCLNRAETLNDFYQSAVAFGRFQLLLADFPARTLHETIAHFHDTPTRYAALHEAVAADVCGRLREVGPELDFVLEREEQAGTLMRMLAAGELPLRVTHNDTKLNNVILDAQTHTPLCVIDLDTVMPGLVVMDFGDSIRYGASTAAEDEPDVSLVSLSLPLFQAYAEGFLGTCGARLTPAERECMPLGAKTITLENGVRFLMDYLQGDVYYATHRPRQNLDRCRTQLALVADMETKWAQMNAAISR